MPGLGRYSSRPPAGRRVPPDPAFSTLRTGPGCTRTAGPDRGRRQADRGPFRQPAFQGRQEKVRKAMTLPFDQRPIIVALAGPNGAGKTTFYHAHLQPAGLRFV